MAKVLILPIKRVWFNKVKSGEKPFEYRVCSPYWTARLSKNPSHVILRNGYSKKSPSLIAEVDFISVVNGLRTDLNIDEPVYAIKLKNINTIENYPEV